MDFSKMAPKEVRQMIREGKITTFTSGMCNGYAQANLAILPKELAFDFLLFTQRNPKPCPVLDVTEVGNPEPKVAAPELICVLIFLNTGFIAMESLRMK